MDEDIMELDVLEGIFEGRIKPTDLKLSALQSITGNFSEDRIIGTGGFGTVYRGVLRKGEVAVKRIHNSHSINEKVFRREVNSLLNVSHENIVRFLGFCSHTEHKVFENEGSESRDYIYAEIRERVLCFEYIKNGTLQKYIADELRGVQWDTRYFIIKGILGGLHYLHMEKQIIHMDLKPGNILIDYNMVAKITDFGLSRMEENAQTKSTTRAATRGYTAPEYIDKGEMSVKCDVYSLGIIIIELVTGNRSIPDINNVLRRWRHTFHKSGKETPFRYQQIAKLIEIGLLCQDNDPYKRPSISDIIRDINELESTDRKISKKKRKISNANDSTVGHIMPYSEDDMLGIEPLELRFPYKVNSHISCSLEITNETNAFMAFSIQTTSPLPYSIQPNKDIVAPRSKYSVNITLQPLDKAPEDTHPGDFIVRSTKVQESLINEDITDDMFNINDGKLVDEVKVTITYKDEVPQVDLSLGSLNFLGMANLLGAQESSVPPTEAESKISASTSDEVIRFDPPELYFPMVPDKTVISSIKIINTTESYVSFCICDSGEKPSRYYSFSKVKSILPPRSMECLWVTRNEKEGAVENMQFNVRYAIVDKDIEVSDLDPEDHTACKKLHIVLTKISAPTSDEVIRFDPPELCFPMVPDKKVLSSIKITNTTESYVSFHICYSMEKPAGDYFFSKVKSTLPPRSMECLWVTRNETEGAVENMQFNEEFNVWYAIVDEDMEAGDLDLEDYAESKKLHIVLTKGSTRTTNELIDFDPPELRMHWIPNKPLVFSVNIINNTDYCVGFGAFGATENMGSYNVQPSNAGFMPPRSTQRLVVKRVPKNKEHEDMQCTDKFFIWSSLVSEPIESSHIIEYANYSVEGMKELPIVYNKTILGTSDELVQFDPPHLPFTFHPNKRVPIFRLFKIVNVTDQIVGFSTRSHEDNSASYIMEPCAGILPPQSTQVIKVRRTLKENQTEDMQCKDKIFVWNGMVTEGVQASDVRPYWKNKDKELPVVLTEITSSTSVELIQFEPPEVCFPFLPRKHLLSSIKILNITDYHIGFNTDAYPTNAASYIMEPKCGVLRPWSTQQLVVTRVAKDEAPELDDMQCKDKFFVWSGLVTEDVSTSDIAEWMPENESKELPIVFTETSSNELIQFDPPELCFPLLTNQGVLSSAKIVNTTDQYIGFRICTKKSNSARYNTNPSEGILPPLSTQVVFVTRIAEEKGLEDTQCTEKLVVWNGIVTDDVKASDVIDKMSEIKCTDLPIVLTETSSSASDELIKFDTPELQFPFLLNKKVMTSIKIVNLTDYNVGFNTYSRPANAAWYHTEPPRGILPPRSTQKLMVTREEKEYVLKDKQFDDRYFVWKSIVSEGVKESDLSDYMADQESIELPIILDKICSSISSELIQFDPAEICIPLLLNKTMLFSVNVVNTTDFYVAFHSYWMERIAPRYRSSHGNGILPPRSTKKLTLQWATVENELEDIEANGSYFVWNRVVTERVESGDIISYKNEEESKKVPLIPNKAIPCTSNELVQFDPPELSLPLMPNKPLVFSVNIVNNIDYCVGFNICEPQENVCWYYIKPEGGVMPPRSTQRIVVKGVPKKNEQEDLQCEDKLYLCCRLVGEGVESNDLVDRISARGTRELPIAYKKSLCTSDEFIQFDPPQLPFTFLPNMRVSMLRKFNIVNVTDRIIGFSTWSHEDNSASYIMEPRAGILPPQSTQTIKVRRTLKENETEDMQCMDKIFVWSGIVTEGVEVSDVGIYWKDEDKELPVVLTKPGESSSR